MEGLRRRESDRGNTASFGEPSARRVVRVPEDTSYVVSDHIHYGTQMDKLDPTQMQHRVMPSEEEQYMNLVYDFFISLRNEFVKSQLAANDEMERFHAMLRRLPD